jgi:hypothetical protein
MTTATPMGPTLPAQMEYMFPTLTPAQIEVVAARGRTRHVEAGDELARPGDFAHLFLVRSGELHIVRPDDQGEMLVAVVNC